MPPADLKERTLATIRAEGVRRPLVAASAAAGTADVAVGAAAEAGAPAVLAPAAMAPAAGGDAARRARRTQWLGWAGTIAAAVLLSVVTTTAVVNNRVDNQIAAQNVEIAALETVATDTMGVAAEPDAEHVALRSVSDPAVAGELVYSSSNTALVVTATGLTQPPTGHVYRCWLEVGGKREPVGRMFFSTHLAYWTGEVAALSGLSDGARFGVSLDSVDSDPVLVGEL
jgi:hypothetical protein